MLASSARRIRVLGASGSGKTTLSRHIAARLDLPLLEIDSLFWLPGWKERENEEFVGLVTEFAQRPAWVMDGNYHGRLGDLLDPLTDLYVWIDLPRWQTASAVLRRTIRRSFTRENLWNTGNRESIGSLFKKRPLDNLVIWSWTQHPRLRARWGPRCEAEPQRWVRLRSRREVADFVASLDSA